MYTEKVKQQKGKKEKSKKPVRIFLHEERSQINLGVILDKTQNVV